MDLLENLNSDLITQMKNKSEKFMKLMMQYECAMIEVKTKLDVLNKELSFAEERNSFDTVLSRLKTPESICEKLERFGHKFTVSNIEEYIEDVAGIRVICSFKDDIYNIAKFLSVQDDIKVIRVKDYIQSPKPNGYRSFHVVLNVPIFFSNEKKYMNVEVQFRTIAMDFWASLEHKMKYKKDMQNPDVITKELLECADLISVLDERMIRIRGKIEGKE